MEFHGHVSPQGEEPKIVPFARALLVTGATTALKCTAVLCLKFGGVQKRNTISQAILDFKAAAGDKSPSATCHPALYEIIKPTPQSANKK